MISRILFLTGLIGMLWVNPAVAACTGSGITWSCPSGSTSADVQAAINAASDGATITFAAGSYSWSSFASFSNSKGATLICASAGACAVTVSGTVLGMNGNLSGMNTRFYRVSGFAFTGGSGFLMWFYGPGTLTQFRGDHNTFTNTGLAFFFGENGTVGNFYGVLDHNTLTNSTTQIFMQIINAVNQSPPSSPLGTANNMFVEDNTINITTMTNAGAGCMDSWGGAAIVWRHNTTLNCLTTAHGNTHAGGPANIELYNNNMRVNSGSSGQGVDDGYRLFHHQGSGEFISFNNSFTASNGKNGTPMAMAHYRSFPNSIDGGAPQCDGTVTNPLMLDGNRSPATTYRGYPCWRQPGRDFAGNLKPMYVWNNYWSDTRAKIDMNIDDFGGSLDYVSNHLVANRDYYNAVSASTQTSPSSPFNGTSGMGFGTLANRPPTCTTNALESGGGVGYFATDQGPQGTLYRCSATNTWTVYYVPYTYPHPLAGGSPAPGPAPGPAPLAPPTNISAIVR